MNTFFILIQSNSNLTATINDNKKCDIRYEPQYINDQNKSYINKVSNLETF